MPNTFFGSKFNTLLLLVLIVLMVFALRFMYKNPDTYIPAVNPKEEQLIEEGTQPALEGKSEDLVSFSVQSGQEVSGLLNFTGSVKNNYFFEANIRVNALDANKKLLKAGHGTATTDWMTAGPVSFSGSIDLTGLPNGIAYIEIANDNPSGLAENSKSIYIPVVIK